MNLYQFFIIYKSINLNLPLVYKSLFKLIRFVTVHTFNSSLLTFSQLFSAFFQLLILNVDKEKIDPRLTWSRGPPRTWP